MKIYTKTGDKGQTSLLGGLRVSKADMRIEAYGTVDELNSQLGMLIHCVKDGAKTQHLLNIQSLLFNIGSYLASETPDHPSLPILDESYVTTLEMAMDEMDKDLKPMRSFILPSGSQAIAQAHICRTVCRRAERRIISAQKDNSQDELIIKIINRLSDYFFVLSRWIAHLEGIEDTPWVPKKDS